MTAARGKGSAKSSGKAAKTARPRRKPAASRATTADLDGPGSERRIRWIVFGAMAAATIAFFASFAFDSGAMLFGTDMLSQAYQSRAFAVQEVQDNSGPANDGVTDAAQT